MSLVRYVSWLRSHRGFDVWGFLLFSHGWTWLWWSVPIVNGWHVFRSPGIAFFLVGGLGVTIGGIVMAGIVDGRAGIQDIWRRLVDPGRVPGRWWLVILGLWLVLAAAGVGVAILLGSPGDPIDLGPLAAELADPIGFLFGLLMVFLLGPLHEEIGWRAYWLDRLQIRWSALTASAIVGVAWAAWHAPLFVMVGYFSSWDFSPDPALFAVNILLGAVLYTWLYNNTNRSVLAVVLFHFAGNATGQFLEFSRTADLAQTAATAVLVVVVLAYWGPRTLRREGAIPGPGEET